jgi:hypothetical protein
MISYHPYQRHNIIGSWLSFCSKMIINLEYSLICFYSYLFSEFIFALEFRHFYFVEESGHIC